MKKRVLYICWGVLYALCAGLGHISQPNDAQSVALTLLSLVFFAPGAILLVDALRSGDQKTRLELRWISGISLGLTLVLLVANLASALGSEVLGTVLYELLIFASVPMVCSRHWALSLFLWACLFFVTFPTKKAK